MNELNQVLDSPEVQQLNAEAVQIAETAFVLKIVTADQYSLAGEKLKEIKGAQKRLDALRKSFTQPLDSAKSAIMDFFRKPEQRLKEAEDSYKNGMLVYVREQNRIAAEAQARLDEQARKEREKLEAQAAKAREAGKIEKANILETKAVLVEAPQVVASQVKVAGQGITKTWNFEIVDASLIPREYLMVDEVKIGKIVRALKSETTIAGIRVFSVDGISSRSR